MYRHDQDIVMREMHGMGIFFWEKDWPTKRCRIVVPHGFFDIDRSLLGSGVFYRGVFEDGVHLPISDEGLPGYSSMVLGCLCTLISKGSPS